MGVLEQILEPRHLVGNLNTQFIHISKQQLVNWINNGDFTRVLDDSLDNRP